SWLLWDERSARPIASLLARNGAIVTVSDSCCDSVTVVVAVDRLAMTVQAAGCDGWVGVCGGCLRTYDENVAGDLGFFPDNLPFLPVASECFEGGQPPLPLQGLGHVERDLSIPDWPVPVDVSRADGGSRPAISEPVEEYRRRAAAPGVSCR